MRISDWSSDVCLPISPLAPICQPLLRPHLLRIPALSFPSSFLLNWSLGIDAAIIACIEAEIARSPEEFRYSGIGAHQHRTGRGNHRVRGRTPGHAFRQTLRSEEHTSELQSLMRTSYAVLCLKITIEK